MYKPSVSSNVPVAYAIYKNKYIIILVRECRFEFVRIFGCFLANRRGKFGVYMQSVLQWELESFVRLLETEVRSWRRGCRLKVIYLVVLRSTGAAQRVSLKKGE